MSRTWLFASSSRAVNPPLRNPLWIGGDIEGAADDASVQEDIRLQPARGDGNSARGLLPYSKVQSTNCNRGAGQPHELRGIHVPHREAEADARAVEQGSGGREAESIGNTRRG